MRVGLHTRLVPGAEEAYEALHRAVWPDVLEAIRSVGIEDWVIFRHGLDLFHCVTCDDYDAAIAALADIPVNGTWQNEVGPHMDVAFDFSEEDPTRMSLIFDLSW